MKYLNLYILVSTPTVFIYKMFQTKNLKVERENNKITRLLLGERLMIASYATLFAPVVFPIVGFNIINNIDNKINNVIEYENKAKPLSSILLQCFS